jgi:hypothetical protein
MLGSTRESDLHILRATIELLSRGDLPVPQKLDSLFEFSFARHLSGVNRRIIPALGEVVAEGPFAGMIYGKDIAEGCTVPKLLGCYEQELHPALYRAIEADYGAILNIGCAEGYYAVGLARVLPTARVFAWDIDSAAREKTIRNAAANGVADRILVEGAFDAAQLDAFDGQRTLVICDVEGAEFELLDPAQSRALAGLDLIVELHPSEERSEREFAARFEATHDVEIIQPEARDPGRFSALTALPVLDRMFALVERLEATPWAVLRSKSAMS